MEKLIARLNIEHFRKLLAEPVDDRSRKTLIWLLAREEGRLAALDMVGPAAPVLSGEVA
jgi:hypothetical protein